MNTFKGGDEYRLFLDNYNYILLTVSYIESNVIWLSNSDSCYKYDRKTERLYKWCGDGYDRVDTEYGFSKLNSTDVWEARNVAYYSACTEYEAGWGVRPDGHIVCLNKEFLQKRVEELNNRPRSVHGYDTHGKPKLCIVTEEMYKKLLDNPDAGYVWAPNNRSTWVVDE